jgi:hypothetical protein
MPNWCVNQVDVSGDETEVARLIEFVKGGGDAFDFAKIVPPPDSPFYSISDKQNHFQCGCVPVYVELPHLPEVVSYTDKDGNDVMRKQGEWQVDGLPIQKVMENNGTIQMYADAMFGGSKVCPVHGKAENSTHPDWWYNWNVKNWGTKWNCSEVWHDRTTEEITEAGRTSYNFDTAWSPSERVIAALAALFPTLAITHRYCEGGMSYAGEVIYNNGVEVSREEHGGDEELPDEAWVANEDGSRGYERDYDKVPMTAYEAFCDEHFGGIVGG